MSKLDENMEWEKEAVYLAKLSRVTPYRAPDQYFEELPARIQQSVFLSELDSKGTLGLNVPPHYFDELPAQIEAKVLTEEMKGLVPETGFQTPVGYFDRLQADILEKTIRAPRPRSVKLWHQDAIKYISAACFIVLAASGLYLNQQHTVKQMASTELAREQMLYDIDENVIFEHIEETQTANTSTSTAEMETYILDNFSTSELSNSL